MALRIRHAQLVARHVEAQRLAAIGQTVAGLAHCVKNILNGIQGGSYILDGALEKDDPTRRDRGWAMVKRNVAFMSDLVMDMLSYARQREPAREPVDPRRLLEDVRQLVDVRRGQKGVQITCQVAPDVQKVPLDVTAMKRCLLNLAGNAVDACDPEGGRVVLGCDRAPEGGAVRFTVADNGCGIPAKHLDHLFEMFFSTKGAKGTGLGLAVSKKIVDEHGGRIHAESRVGEGTQFVIDLPLGPP
jgi:signal transduction histidine kinase